MTVVHCWEDGPRVEVEGDPDGVGSTCMLLDGHAGPHRFTPDNRIGVVFAPAQPSASRDAPQEEDVTRVRVFFRNWRCRLFHPHGFWTRSLYREFWICETWACLSVRSRKP